jgi:PKD repeat protein
MQTTKFERCVGGRVTRARCPEGRIMLQHILIFLLLLAGTGPARLLGAVHYVDANSSNALPPYTNWATAAAVIQDAIDGATAGDEVVVTNGIYARGGRAVGTSAQLNRVAIGKPLTLRSVNGPEFTLIVGSKATNSTTGEGAIRCAYLANGVSLSGFTLTNGGTQRISGGVFGGGAWCESTNAVLWNCILAGNSADQSGGGVCGGVLNHCLLTGNQTYYGGGACSNILNDCTLSGNWAKQSGGGAYASVLNNCGLYENWAPWGGGAYGGTLNNCTLGTNQASNWSDYRGRGGGAYNATLNHCTLSGNWSLSYGGGAAGSTLNNCLLIGNEAGLEYLSSSEANGGGADYSTLRNCALTGNRAWHCGGGAYRSTLVNCTVTGNSARQAGGGVYGDELWDDFCALTNSIVYWNQAPYAANYPENATTLDHCCTWPLPAAGIGNITSDPQLASASHLSAGSPCLGKGNPDAAAGTDIDGEPWTNPPSIGCDECIRGSVTGNLEVTIATDYTNVAVGFTVRFKGLISGRVASSSWDFGDGTVVSNQPYASHAWSKVGEYTVVLSGFNDSNPGGVTATSLIQVIAQPVHFVSQGNLNPGEPYGSWESAATNIQDAVYAASVPGSLILVSNGTYEGTIYVSGPVIVQSVNGPEFTAIEGRRWSAGDYGIGFYFVGDRCVYLENGASVSGFTLTNGCSPNDFPGFDETSYGGGAWCASAREMLSNCVIGGNAATYGGGVYGGTLNKCILISNETTGPNWCGGSGAGAYYSTLNNCTLVGNRSEDTYAYNNWPGDHSGGGAYGSILNNCTLRDNFAEYGGGVARSMVLNSTFMSNSAYSGGGVEVSSVRGCAFYGNSAGEGGGACGGTLHNCTLIGNSGGTGGGAYYSVLNNCIAYDNTADKDANWSASMLNNCCTTPQPTNGTGNITADPQMADPAHLSPGSPCRGAGSAAYADGLDIDGEPWARLPSMGCDEFHSGGITGTLAVTLAADYTNLVPGYVVNINGRIAGHASANVWDFGDGTVLSNRLFVPPHAWIKPGDYAVVLRAYNESHPAGVSATVLVHVVTSRHYVAAGNAHPAPPYTSWATAATNIQDALDVAATGGEIIVTNGLYQSGAREFYATTNRVVVDKPVLLRSVNGPQFTIIQGSTNPAVRCVLLTSPGGLSGFTLTGGGADYGGGVCNWTGGSTVSNCVITGNWASSSGGGAHNGTLNHCLVISNSSSWCGGGAYCSSLNNCILKGNSTGDAGGGVAFGVLNNCLLLENQTGNSGGGAHGGTLHNCTVTRNSASGTHASSGCAGGTYGAGLNNCIVYFNTAASSSNYYQDSYLLLTNCCTTPMPSGGSGNITNAPLFLDLASGDLRLQSNSPCINAGNNAYAFGPTDLGGQPRIVSSTVDIGAYEFQGQGSKISYAWLQKYGFPTDGSADDADPDQDDATNYREWQSGSDPLNAQSSPPVILAQPVAARVVPGDTMRFNVTATGTAPLDYQWLFNDTNSLAGATNSVLVLASVDHTNAGGYCVRISNVYGALLSSNAVLAVDHAPVADASASRLLSISRNGRDGTVILDGSRSADTDGDLLQYFWFASAGSGPSSLIASGVVAVMALPFGSHLLALVVDDGLLSATNRVKAEVLTPAQGIQRLMAEVRSNWPRSQPLIAVLTAALRSVEKGNLTPALNELQAFQNQVRAQLASSDPALAASFIQSAQDIVDALTGGDMNPGGRLVQFSSAVRQSNGKAHLHFSGVEGRLCIVEASTNLLHWEKIGTPVDRGDGTFEFEDSQSAQFPRRFYRVLFP